MNNNLPVFDNKFDFDDYIWSLNYIDKSALGFLDRDIIVELIDYLEFMKELDNG